jgi:hypothetical protein
MIPPISGPRLISLVVCSYLETHPSVTLYDVRRHWPDPPRSFCLFADIENPTEEAFSWKIQLYRGRRFIDETVETLELGVQPRRLLTSLLSIPRAKPHTYRLKLLLNNNPAGTIPVDLGYPESNP